LTRGDTYYIADGTYGGYTFDDADSGSTWIYIKKATVSAHGTSTGWSDTYGDGTATFTGQFLIRTNYLEIDGVTGGGPGNWEGPFGFKSITDQSIAGTAPRNFYFDTSGKGNYITFTHIEATKTNVNPTSTDIDDWNDSILYALFIGSYSNVTISYCWWHYSGRGMFYWNPTSSIVEYSKLGNNIYYSPVQNGHSDVILIYNGLANMTVRYNYFYDVGSSGAINCLGTNNSAVNGVYIYGNIFDGNNTNPYWWISCGWSDLAQIPSNWKIYNNTFINLRDGAFVGAFNDGGSGNEMKNNIFWYTPGTGPRFVNMIPHGTSTKQVDNDYNWYTGDTYYNSYGEANSINGGSADPFVNNATGNYTLSNPISGLNLGSPYNYDMQGAIHGADGVWDRGAYEYGSRSPSIVPMPPEILNIK
jgi:hypothetical protein